MNQRGQVYPLFGLLLVALLGFAALSIDMGYYRYQQRLQQTATDSAAIAGAQASVYATPNAQYAAFADAATNGFASPSATVSVDPNYSDSYTTDAPNGTGVQVTITKNYAKWFSGFFGGGSQAVGTTAVARMRADSGECIVGLDPSKAMTMNGQKFGGGACTIAENGTMDCHGGDYSTVAGITVNITNNAGFSGCHNGPTPGFTAFVPDPCPDVPGCWSLTNTPYTTLGTSCDPQLPACQSGGLTCTTPAAVPAAGATAVPGSCYNGPTSLPNNVHFPNGLYVFVNGVTFTTGDQTATGGGATFYIASGAMNVGNGNDSIGTSTAPLSAPTTSSPWTTSTGWAGVLFYQPAANTSTVWIGADLYTNGMWYFPTAQYTENGHHTHSYTGDVVFGSITWNGGNTTDIFPGPTGGAGTPERAVLTE
jgi:hypothetical protein